MGVTCVVWGGPVLPLERKEKENWEQKRCSFHLIHLCSQVKTNMKYTSLLASEDLDEAQGTKPTEIRFLAGWDLYVHKADICVWCVCVLCVCVCRWCAVCVSLLVSLSLCLYSRTCLRICIQYYIPLPLSLFQVQTHKHSRCVSVCGVRVCLIMWKRECRHVHGHSWCRVSLSLSLSLSSLRGSTFHVCDVL